jgi:plastocyanin
MPRAAAAALCATVAAVVCTTTAGPARGQTLLERIPNVSGGWVGPAGTLHFNFLHRFNQSGAPQRQVTNRPTFLLAAGVGGRALAGVHYATRSDVVARMPNEWEVFGRYAVLQPDRGVVGLAVQAAYNASARSADAEVSATRGFDRIRLAGAARVFSAAYGGETRGAVAAGALVRLTSALAIAADVGTLLSGETGEEPAWGVGLHGVIPTTPHSFSLQATNTSSATLQGVSRGGSEIRWGFEFTVPLTLRRYFGARGVSTAGTDPIPGDAFRAGMRELAYTPAQITITAGTTVVWRNDDVVEHSVTAVDGSWDSGVIMPGAAWQRAFPDAGTFEFFCTPHPFMRGTVVVRQP